MPEADLNWFVGNAVETNDVLHNANFLRRAPLFGFAMWLLLTTGH